MKIKNIIFWGCMGIADLYGAGIAWHQASQPPAPVSAEQRARNERLATIDAAMDALQNERDEIDPPNDDNGRESEHEYY